MMELHFYVISGVIMAAIWALPAAGVSLIYGVLRYPNFAVAEYVTLGAYMALALSQAGLALPVAALAGAVIVGLVAVTVDQGVFRRVRGAGILPPILLSLGLMLVLQNVVRFFWGNGVYQYPLPLQPPFRFAGFIMTQTQLIAVMGALGLLVLLHVGLRRTAYGRDVRAVANNPPLALTCGVMPERVYVGVIFATAALAALGGVALGAAGSIHPLMGWHSMIPIFAVAILGGLGNVLGVVLAAILLGMASEFSLFWLQSSYKPVIAFAALALVLLLRPGGLLKGER